MRLDENSLNFYSEETLNETLIGFFTKYGDGGADFFPIIHSYKTQVRRLTNYLGAPERIAFKPSSPQLYPGHKLSDGLPLEYDSLDTVLVGLFDYRLPPGKVSEMLNVPLRIVEKALRCHVRTEHKWKRPLQLEVDGALHEVSLEYPYSDWVK